MPSEGTSNKPNLRNTRIFREELLAALGVTADKDVENEGNFKSALLDALGVDHIPQDVSNFEKFREKLIEAADGIGSGGGSSDFSIAVGTLHTSIESKSVTVGQAVIIDESEPVNPMIPYYENDWYDNNTLNFVLYNGIYSLIISSTDYTITNISVEGGAEVVDPLGIIEITGDFTLNVTLSE